MWKGNENIYSDMLLNVELISIKTLVQNIYLYQMAKIRLKSIFASSTNYIRSVF